MAEKLYFDGMHGIGDSINQRSFIKALVARGHEVWLRTPVPEIYDGIAGLHFVHANTTLRTQKKNEGSSTVKFEPEPPDIQRRRIFYGNSHLLEGGIFDAMEKQFGIAPDPLDLPNFELPDLQFPDKPIALIRPTTERTEWHNAARGPLNQYIDIAGRMLARRGYHVVSVASCEEGQEWIPDIEPFAHQQFNHGELTMTQMLALVEQAAIVVTGPCVMMHAALAYNRPMIFIGGGNGGNNHHTKVTDTRCSDLSAALFVYPDRFCMCQEMKHNCDKTITSLVKKLIPFMDWITDDTAARQ